MTKEKLPDYEFSLTLDDIAELENERSENTVTTFFDEATSVTCKLSKFQLALNGLRRGLTSIGGEVIEDNFDEVFFKYASMSQIIEMYNDMLAKALKKKS